MGTHALALPITSSDTEAASLLLKALNCFKHGYLNVAYRYVDLAQEYCHLVNMSAADFGRLLLELAYEMARENLDDTVIEPLLRRANDIMTYDLTGYMEVIVTTGRIHLLRNKPVKALRLYGQITDLLMSINGAVDKSFIDYFNSWNERAREAVAKENAEIAYLEILFRCEPPYPA